MRGLLRKMMCAPLLRSLQSAQPQSQWVSDGAIHPAVWNSSSGLQKDRISLSVRPSIHMSDLIDISWCHFTALTLLLRLHFNDRLSACLRTTDGDTKILCLCVTEDVWELTSFLIDCDCSSVPSVRLDLGLLSSHADQARMTDLWVEWMKCHLARMAQVWTVLKQSIASFCVPGGLVGGCRCGEVWPDCTVAELWEQEWKHVEKEAFEGGAFGGIVVFVVKLWERWHAGGWKCDASRPGIGQEPLSWHLLPVFTLSSSMHLCTSYPPCNILLPLFFQIPRFLSSTIVPHYCCTLLTRLSVICCLCLSMYLILSYVMQVALFVWMCTVAHKDGIKSYFNFFWIVIYSW